MASQKKLQNLKMRCYDQYNHHKWQQQQIPIMQLTMNVCIYK
jgi:hypothetical protein